MKIPALLALLSPLALADGQITSLQTIGYFQGGLGPVLDEDDRFGAAVARLGDVDGDGVQDIAVGAPGTQTYGMDGAVWILLLQTDGSVKSATRIDAADIGHPYDVSSFGRAVGKMGDFDGNGVPDVIVGGIEEQLFSDKGVAHILCLNADGSLASTHEVSVGMQVLSFGASVVGVGDVDGDGIRDAAVGMPGDYAFASDGDVFLILLNADGSEKSSVRISDGQGGFAGPLMFGDHFGSALTQLSDLDGNGVRELAVGASDDDDGYSSGAGHPGAVWVLFLDNTGQVIDQQKISEFEGDLGLDLNSGDHFGTAMGAADVDDDGILDLVVGGETHLWVLILRSDGSVRATLEFDPESFGLDADVGFALGANVLPDIDGDGHVELVVGSPESLFGGLERGSVQIAFFDGVSPAQVLPLGCDLNPAGSLVVHGLPIPGKTMHFKIDNPLGTQTPWQTVPLLSLSFHGTGPGCGISVPGWGMNPAAPSGELLSLQTPGLPLMTNGNWQGTPMEFVYEIPPLPGLLGLEAYVQGVFVDFSASPQVPIGLTRARKLLFGI